MGKRNKTVSDPVQVATGFNNFFTGIGIKLAQKIQPYKNYYPSLFKKNMTNSIFLTDTTPAAIAKLISSLDTKKLLGPKSVPTFILKFNIHLFSQIIFFIENNYFHEGVFPQFIKTAKVIIELVFSICGVLGWFK